MIEIYWAGIGHDESIADRWWTRWWRESQPHLDRFVAGKMATSLGDPFSIRGPVFGWYEYQRYLVTGWTVVDIYRTYQTDRARVGFGILAESQAHAIDQLPMAVQILGIAGLSRLSGVASVWTIVAPDPIMRRLP